MTKPKAGLWDIADGTWTSSLCTTGSAVQTDRESAVPVDMAFHQWVAKVGLGPLFTLQGCCKVRAKIIPRKCYTIAYNY